MNAKADYLIKKGLMYENGKPVISLGVSYYASYHPQKVPVLESGDREGEMRKDLAQIREAGFNTVRCGALGNIRRSGEQAEVSFPFIDSMLREAEKVGLGFTVRLQGYDMILGDYKDGTMLDSNGNEMPFHWGWFVRNCMNHPGVIDDNRLGTRCSAEHFSKFPSVLAFQIYNEPAYPWKSSEYTSDYDYNPHTIEAYRQWLKENGLRDTPPPRQKPQGGENMEEWKKWRLFNMQRLNDFLCQVGNFAKLGSPDKEVFTCHMPCPLESENATRGEDYFVVSQGMDLLGLTTYLPFEGPEYFTSVMTLDCTESAAAVFGKTAWTIECNGRTKMTDVQWERETYCILGSGHKGIHYYQWRADYPFEGSPEPQAFGILWADGTKTEKFETVIKMNKLINSISNELALSGKIRSKAAILYSNNTMVHQDAVRGSGKKMIDSIKTIYKMFREKYIAVDFVRAQDIVTNPLDIQLLIVPQIDGLDEKEIELIGNFPDRGGYVAVLDERSGDKFFFQRDRALLTSILSGNPSGNTFNIDELLESCSISPQIKLSGSPFPIDVKLLGSEQALIITLINYNPEDIADPFEITLKTDMPSTADFITTSGSIRLDCESVEDHWIKVKIPYLKTGAFIILKNC
jgi:hypothetical protein